MLDKLLSLFGVGAIHRVNMVVNIASQIVNTFEKEFAQDKDGKKAAIDTLIDLLQKHKDAQ